MIDCIISAALSGDEVKIKYLQKVREQKIKEDANISGMIATIIPYSSLHYRQHYTHTNG